jgi:peptidoglycan/xylan/chitin deacetylase (PgdA/CDA1 family)
VVNQFIKKRAEAALLKVGAARVAKLLSPRNVLILAYHNIVPDDAAPFGDRSLHLSLKNFCDQLDYLMRAARVVPLESVVHSRPGAERPRVAVTFDDAYQGAVTLGVQALLERGLPGTIFVAPAFLGGESYWWDELANGQGLSGVFRQRAIEDLFGQDDIIREWTNREGLRRRVPPRYGRTATMEELRAAAANTDIAVASHSWSHPNLTKVSTADVRGELVRPLEWLAANFGSFSTWLAYPYGLASPTVERAAEEAGYQAAVRVDGGWIQGLPESLFSLPRLNVPAGLSLNGFKLRLAGILCR